MPHQCEILLHDRPSEDILTRLQINGSATQRVTLSVTSHPYGEEPETEAGLGAVLTDKQAETFTSSINEYLKSRSETLNFHAQAMNEHGAVMLAVKSLENQEIGFHLVHFDSADNQCAAAHLNLNRDEAGALAAFVYGIHLSRGQR